MPQGPAYNVKVPYHWIQGLPRVAQEQIWRNFEELSIGFTALTSTNGYDALVNCSLTTDSPSTHVYSNVAAAVNAEVAAHPTVLRIGVIPIPSPTTGTQDAAQVSTWPTWTMIDAVGFAGVASYAQPKQASWYFAGKSHPAPPNLICRGIYINPGNNGTNQIWGTVPTGCSHIFTDCYIDAEAEAVNNGSATTLLPAGQSHTLYGRNTRFLDCQSGAQVLQLDDCFIHYNVASTATWGDNTLTGSSLLWAGCRLSSSTFGATLTMGAFYTTIVAAAQDMGPFSNPAVIKFVPGQQNMRLAIDTRGIASSGSNFSFDVDTSGANGTNIRCALTGAFRNVTLTAPNATGHDGHFVSGYIDNALDVTGPARLDVAVLGSTVTLRGDHISGSIISNTAGGASTANLYFVGCTNSVIQASCSTSSYASAKPYSFDATSTENVLILVGTDNYGVAGSDASAGPNLVITEDGAPSGPPSGAAGGDLSGTYPNPTVAAIQGEPVAATDPGDANLLIHNSGTDQWAPAALSGDATMTNAGVVTLANSGVTAGTVAPIGTVPRLTVDAKGRLTTLTDIIDFAQAFMT